MTGGIRGMAGMGREEGGGAGPHTLLKAEINVSQEKKLRR